MKMGSMLKFATVMLAVVSFGMMGCQSSSKQTLSYDNNSAS